LSRKFRGKSQNSFRIAYIPGDVALECATIDLQHNTASICVVSINVSTNGSALEIACPPPGIGAKLSRKLLETASELLTLLPQVLLSKVLSWMST
jgi:hypothetical protein